MVYNTGRFLQIVGLVLTPVGIAGNLARPENVEVKTTLVIAATAVAIFVIGWLLQQYAKRKDNKK